MFLFPGHQERLDYLIKKDKKHPQDFERISMFYVFAGNEELVGKVGSFYDFVEQMIKTEGLNEVKLSSAEVLLVKLAFNLYNNSNRESIVDLFSNLDKRNRVLAINAIKLRFKV